MEELNTCQGVDVITEEGFDNLTVTDLGEAVALAQIAEDQTLHNVVISREMLKAAYEAVFPNPEDR